VVKSSWIAMLAVCACLPAGAMAQYVFFDDFNGNDLLPHWGQPPAQDWEYNVSGGMLNVTGLFYPPPPFPVSNAAISAQFEPLSDFRVDVWMGWQAGDAPHRIVASVLGPWGPGPIIAEFGYRHMHSTLPQEIVLGTGTSAVFLPAPTAGIHHFTVTRSGAEFAFYLNGGHLATFPDLWGTPAGGIGIEFVGPTQGQFGTLHVDRVQVIPSPGPLMLIVACAALAARCRRRPRVLPS
jgi:hypothetical protein